MKKEEEEGSTLVRSNGVSQLGCLLDSSADLKPLVGRLCEYLRLSSNSDILFSALARGVPCLGLYLPIWFLDTGAPRTYRKGRSRKGKKKKKRKEKRAGVMGGAPSPGLTG